MLLNISVLTDFDGPQTVLVNPESIGLVEEGPAGKALIYVQGRDRPLKYSGSVADFETLLRDTWNNLQEKPCSSPPEDSTTA